MTASWKARHHGMTARDNPPFGAATKFLQKILFFAFGPVSKAYALRSGNTEEASVKGAH